MKSLFFISLQNWQKRQNVQCIIYHNINIIYYNIASSVAILNLSEKLKAALWFEHFIHSSLKRLEFQNLEDLVLNFWSKFQVINEVFFALRRPLFTCSHRIRPFLLFFVVALNWRLRLASPRCHHRPHRNTGNSNGLKKF